MKNYPCNRKPVIIDGMRYASLTEAADACFVSRDALRNYIKGKHRKSSLNGRKVEMAEPCHARQMKKPPANNIADGRKGELPRSPILPRTGKLVKEGKNDCHGKIF